jgi:hypothetical protein
MTIKSAFSFVTVAARAASRIARFSLLLMIPGLIFIGSSGAQNLPDEIRGYKVHHAKVALSRNGEKQGEEDIDIAVNPGNPTLKQIYPLALAFNLPIEMTVYRQNAKIDFLSFKNFRVNGIAVNIDDYMQAFEVKKDKQFSLEPPLSIYVPTIGALSAAIGEWTNSKPEWDVSGTVYVFGRFKKIGFSFKRVVPVDVNLRIRNPLRSGIER